VGINGWKYNINYFRINNVTANGANFTRALTDGSCFFRVDNLGKGSDSTWYRILSVQNDNQLTLATVFAMTSVTIANYTISKAPEYPTRLHVGIIYGVLRQLTIDQNDPKRTVLSRSICHRYE